MLRKDLPREHQASVLALVINPAINQATEAPAADLPREGTIVFAGDPAVAVPAKCPMTVGVLVELRQVPAMAVAEAPVVILAMAVAEVPVATLVMVEAVRVGLPEVPAVPAARQGAPATVGVVLADPQEVPAARVVVRATAEVAPVDPQGDQAVREAVLAMAAEAVVPVGPEVLLVVPVARVEAPATVEAAPVGLEVPLAGPEVLPKQGGNRGRSSTRARKPVAADSIGTTGCPKKSCAITARNLL
ncbi:hypothetical protein SAMN05920897_102183 [Alkalispirochaeta americana]|uniref:Uncharacterized protein n=1 Tax=Alkalispirochaeta americana TaxID=159291 RepID=A0A1N6P8S0_9SPIO|nr:hypothetical protein SAMN05920897_102183 [Alkalispirochaeta americana]